MKYIYKIKSFLKGKRIILGFFYIIGHISPGKKSPLVSLFSEAGILENTPPTPLELHSAFGLPLLEYPCDANSKVFGCQAWF